MYIDNDNAIYVSPKVELGANYLKFSKNVSSDELNEIFTSLVKCSNASLFWIGDFLNYAEGSKGEKYRRIYEETDYAPQTLHNCKRLCKCIQPAQRLNLSFKHHAEALAACRSDVGKAIEFLELAQREGMSVKAMRAHIRLSLADPGKIGTNDLKAINTELGVVLDAINTVKRYLNNIGAGEPELLKKHLKAELEKLFAVAEKRLK